MDFIVQKLKSKHTSNKKYLYKLRKTNTFFSHFEGMRGGKTQIFRTSGALLSLAAYFPNTHFVFIDANPVSISILKAKLYILSTINFWKKVLSTAIWADENGLVFGRIACISSKNLRSESSLYLEFIQFRIYFYPKNLKSEINNPRFNILLHTLSIVWATV